MITNGNKCKFRYKYGRFIFSKFQCDIAIPGKKWIGQASKAVCNICRVNEYEVTYDCIHYRIGTEKLYSDKNEVIVRGFCFFEFKDVKDFRNEIKYDNCGPNKCPHKAYIKRPKSEPIKPAIQEEKTVARPASASIIPLGLKIWTILPALPLTIFGILLTIRNIPQIFSKAILTVFLFTCLILLLVKLLLKGGKWALELYRISIVLAGTFWFFALFGHTILKKATNITYLQGEIALFFSIIGGIIISFAVVFNKLGKVEEKIYGTKQKKKLYPIFIGGIFISSLIFANLSKETSSRISPTSPPAPAPATKSAPPRTTSPVFKPSPPPAPFSDSTNSLITKKKDYIRRLLNVANGLYIRYKEYDKAIEKFDMVLEIDPKNLKALIGKGTILHDLGAYQRAIECYREALKINPGNQDALSGIEKTKSASEAEERIKKR